MDAVSGGALVSLYLVIAALFMGAVMVAVVWGANKLVGGTDEPHEDETPLGTGR